MNPIGGLLSCDVESLARGVPPGRTRAQGSVVALATIMHLGAAVLALVVAGCNLRLGSSPSAGSSGDAARHPTIAPSEREDGGGGGGDDGGPAPLRLRGGDVTSAACARVTKEVRVDAGSGATSFALAWDEDHYLVVFSDPTSGAGDLYAVRLDRDGNVLGPATVVEATGEPSELPSLARAGDRFFVAWQEGGVGKATLAAALDRTGARIADPVTIAPLSLNDTRPVLSAAPSGVAVAWTEHAADGLHAKVSLLDPTLAITASAELGAGAVASEYPAIAGDASALTAIWSQQTTGPFDLSFAALDPSSALPSGERALRAAQPNDALLGRAIRAGEHTLAAWEDLRDPDQNQIFMALVGGDGAVAASGLVEDPGSGDANWPNLAWDGARAAVVFYQWRDTSPQIYLTLLDAAGARIGGHDARVSDSPGTARFPDVVWNGADFGVAWIDTRDGAPRLYFTRVACEGRP